MRRPPLRRGAMVGAGSSSDSSESEAGAGAFWSALFSFLPPSLEGFLRDAAGLGEASVVLLLVGFSVVGDLGEVSINVYMAIVDY